MSVQQNIVDFLKTNNGVAVVDVSEAARNFCCSLSGVGFALHSLLKRGVISKTLEGTTEMSTSYTLIGELPVKERKTTVRRNGLNSDLLLRAMEQVAGLKSTQDQLLAALEREKEKDKKIYKLEKQLVEIEEELRSTDAQLADEQRKLLDLLQSAERNNKMITKKLEFDGRGVQRTAGV